MFGGIGITEMVVIGIVAVLLFGQRLPEVARNFGRTYRDFRKTLNDIKSTIDLDEPLSSDHEPSDQASSYDPMDDIDEPTSPKLKPPSDD